MINLKMKPAGAEIIGDVLVSHRNGQQPKLLRTSQKLLIIQKALARMQTEGNGRLDVEALARELNINYRTFRHTFQKYTGLSPHSYLINLRLTQARNLLTHTPQTAKEIARSIGFKDKFYFYRLFKKRVGMTPKQWRFYSLHTHV